MSVLEVVRQHVTACARRAACGIVLSLLVPVTAFALPGYANLINGFCNAQGAARVRYTDDGCTLCHHPGTFTAEPAHRVEPVWSEFELGRTSNDYSFFCPAKTDVGSSITGADLSATPEVNLNLPAPTQGGPLSHAEMPWMALGYPSGHAKAESLDPNQPLTPAPSKRAPSEAPRGAIAAPNATRGESVAADETKRQLDKLRSDLGLSQAQQTAWAELQDALLAMRRATAATQPADAALADRIEEEQRRHALSIARLRAVDTALVRLNAHLTERQQRLLTARLSPLLKER